MPGRRSRLVCASQINVCTPIKQLTQDHYQAAHITCRLVSREFRLADFLCSSNYSTTKCFPEPFPPQIFMFSNVY